MIVISMNQVTARLWIGDASDALNVGVLHAHGVNAVMNATAEEDRWPEEYKQIATYVQLNQNDGEFIPMDKIAQFREWMVEMFVKQRRTVLIHCGAGISRASTFTIFWLMLGSGVTWDTAEALVRQCRPQINPHPNLKHSIGQFLGS